MSDVTNPNAVLVSGARTAGLWLITLITPLQPLPQRSL